MYSLSFFISDSFLEYLYTIYLDLNPFFKQVTNAIVGFATLTILGILWILISEIKDHFIKQFKDELEEIEKQEKSK